ARAALDERFTRLVLDYQRRIHRFIFGMVQNEAQAEDLTQEVFLLAYRALGRLPDDANESAWLFTIARNRALQELRRRKILPWGETASAWLDGELSPVEAARFQTHAATCSACSARMTAYQRLGRDLTATAGAVVTPASYRIFEHVSNSQARPLAPRVPGRLAL